MGCEADRSPLKTILENQVEDAEVRIAAFLQIMRCPTYDTIQSIKTFLETEEVNQGRHAVFLTIISPNFLFYVFVLR